MDRRKLAFKMLVVTSILFVSSPFIYVTNPSVETKRLMGIMTLIYLVVIAWNTSYIFKPSHFLKHLGNEINSANKEKKYFKATVFAAIAPMMVIGLIFIALDLIVLIFL